MSEFKDIGTQCIHAGEPLPRVQGAVTLPIFQSSTFEMSELGPRYIRFNNTPNHEALHGKIAALEGAEAAAVTSSGMSAVSTAMLSVLRQGDHLLLPECLYGGTHAFVTQELAKFGVTWDWIDLTRPDSWRDKLKKNTKIIYAESITNPLMQVGELDAVVRFARDFGLVSMIDNTFASPLNYRAAASGYDLVIHSCTKYLNGHSDLVAGAVAGKAELMKAVARTLINHGGSLNPIDCFLLQRGIKTLHVRMRQHNENALQLARFLQAHPAVAAVNYPGLETAPDHARARRLLKGFSGMLSFTLKEGLAAAERLVRRVRLPVEAVSLGGIETLIARPCTASHASVPSAERLRMGVTDDLVRVSVGIEGIEDLIADFDQALS